MQLIAAKDAHQHFDIGHWDTATASPLRYSIIIHRSGCLLRWHIHTRIPFASVPLLRENLVNLASFFKRHSALRVVKETIL